MPVSSEFVSLCQAQVALLTQGLGASQIAVYLTEASTSEQEQKLVAVVTYPETAIHWGAEFDWFQLPESYQTGMQRWQSLGSPALLQQADPATPTALSETNPILEPEPPEEEIPLQMVLPLVHEGGVVGLLVAQRQERPWNEQEQCQIEQVAHTLAIARFLDQRGQWLEQSQQQRRLMQSQQQDVLHTLLHQFRNPLTALRTFGKLLLRRLLPGDPNREVATSIVRESDRLQELLQQFDQVVDAVEVSSTPLLPSTVDSGDSGLAAIAPKPIPLLPATGWLSSRLELQLCSLNQILEPLLVSAQAMSQEHQLELMIHLEDNLPLIQGNAAALREVFSNLIDNALKYTPATGWVSVQSGCCSQQGQDGVAVWIHDTGPGIPPEDLAHVFERHYRGIQAETNIPGTGLGLAIAQGLVQQMQGQIQVFSPHLLEANIPISSDHPGSSFVVWLPRVTGSEVAPVGQANSGKVENPERSEVQ